MCGPNRMWTVAIVLDGQGGKAQNWVGREEGMDLGGTGRRGRGMAIN